MHGLYIQKFHPNPRMSHNYTKVLPLNPCMSHIIQRFNHKLHVYMHRLYHTKVPLQPVNMRDRFFLRLNPFTAAVSAYLLKKLMLRVDNSDAIEIPPELIVVFYCDQMFPLLRPKFFYCDQNHVNRPKRPVLIAVGTRLIQSTPPPALIFTTRGQPLRSYCNKSLK